jgi:hypothetical protein
MNNHFADLAILSKVLGFPQRVLVGGGRGHTDHIHEVALHHAVVVQVAPVRQRVDDQLGGGAAGAGDGVVARAALPARGAALRHRRRRQLRAHVRLLLRLLLLLALFILLYNSVNAIAICIRYGDGLRTVQQRHLLCSVYGREGVGVRVVGRPTRRAQAVQVLPDMMPAPHTHLCIHTKVSSCGSVKQMTARWPTYPVAARAGQEVFVAEVHFLHAERAGRLVLVVAHRFVLYI